MSSSCYLPPPPPEPAEAAFFSSASRCFSRMIAAVSSLVLMVEFCFAPALRLAALSRSLSRWFPRVITKWGRCHSYDLLAVLRSRTLVAPKEGS